MPISVCSARAHGRRHDAVAAEGLHLVEGRRVLGAVERRRRRHAELRRPSAARRARTSPQCAPSASGIWLIGSWRQAPGASLGDVVDAHAGLGVARSRRRPAAPGSPRRRACRASMPRVLRAPLAARRSARGPRRAARRRRSACEGNSATSVSCAAWAMAASSEVPRARARQAGVAPVAAGDRVHRVEDRDVHDRHRAAGAARDRAARRRRGPRRAPAACDRARSRRSRCGSSAAPRRVPGVGGVGWG